MGNYLSDVDGNVSSLFGKWESRVDEMWEIEGTWERELIDIYGGVVVVGRGLTSYFSMCKFQLSQVISNSRQS